MSCCLVSNSNFNSQPGIGAGTASSHDHCTTISCVLHTYSRSEPLNPMKPASSSRNMSAFDENPGSIFQHFSAPFYCSLADLCQNSSAPITSLHTKVMNTMKCSTTSSQCRFTTQIHAQALRICADASL